ncbi:hypothetical protein SDC9_161288 [bioreactor metagenome]|uniref:Uncharacterized protein n=1 Tax=bioreactor metagenome TaxID=1076179 RepID=A0A645FK74_9ZZZZ
MKRLDIGKLEIESGEFRRVPVGIRLFRAKNGPCFKDSLKSRSHRHLFVELRALREICFFVEITHFEYIRATLARRRDQLWCVNLQKLPLYEEGAHCAHKTSLHLKDQPLLLGAQIDPAIIQPCVDVCALAQRQSGGEGEQFQPGGDQFPPAKLDLRVFLNRSFQ